jgi:hypothetical protein
VKFDLCLRVTADDGSVIEHHVFAFSRANPLLETLGMTLEEGKKLLKAVQQRVIEAQTVAFVESHQACPDCGQQRLVKGSRYISFITLFGARDCTAATAAPTKPNRSAHCPSC